MLQWGQPMSARPNPVPAVELIASSIKKPWLAIRVDPTGPDGGFDHRQTHFFVDCEGRWSATESWQSQAQLGGKGVIRIALMPMANTNQVAQPQWNTTQVLLRILCEECRIPTRDIKINDSLATPPVTLERNSTVLRTSTAAQAGLIRK